MTIGCMCVSVCLSDPVNLLVHFSAWEYICITDLIRAATNALFS